jgi:hypothetical protein
VREYYDRIAIAYINDLNIYGTVEKLGVYASVVKYRLEDKDIEETLNNEDFVIVDEIVFEHVEEDN